jgi:diguanylate cyclase (GGDEF)-like protein
MNVDKPTSSLRRLARSQWSGAVLFQAKSNLYLAACVALLLAFTEVLAQFHLRDIVQADFGLEVSPWLVLVGFFVAARYSLRERISGTVQVLNAPEIILIPAMFGTRPLHVVGAALIGTALGSGTGRNRLMGWRLMFQVALTGAETGVVLSLMRRVDELFVLRTSTWLAALLVVVGVRLIRIIVALAVIAFSGAPVPKESIFPTIGVGLISCSAFASASLVATMVSTQSHAALFLVIGLITMAAIAYRSLVDLRDRHARLRLLHNFTGGLTRSVALDDVIHSALDLASSVLQVEGAEITLFETGAARRSAVGSAEEAAPVPSTDDWLWKSTLEPRRTVVCLGENEPEAEYLGTVGLRDAMAAPLLHGGDLLGVVAVRNRDPELTQFSAGERELFTTMAEQTAVAIHAAQLERQIRTEEAERIRAATLDSLTGLANRGALNEAIDAFTHDLTESSPTAGAILTLDLNRFKDVNSTLGHAVGDSLVIAVANRISEAAPRNSVVARLGGDEMAILARNVRDPAQARALANAIRSAVDADHRIGDLTVTTNAAIGVALIPDHGLEHGELMRRAAVAMYQAKLHRDSAIEVFDPDLEEVSTRKLELLNDLRDALDRDALAVHFQPKSDIATETIVGAEALVRWIHPVHGFVSPEEFVGLAEHAGLVGRLTKFVLDESLRQCRLWHEQGLPIRVSVNLSARSLREFDLVEQVADALERAGVEPRMLTLEVTETEIVSDSVAAMAILEGLRTLGVSISIDDFGTGYSSLAYLARLPADEVKIDKSFVIGLPDDEVSQAIVRAVVELSARVGMRTVAEGVEDAQTLQLLQELGVETAQGYFISRPIPAESFAMWLWERRRDGLRVDSQAVKPLKRRIVDAAVVGSNVRPFPRR